MRTMRLRDLTAIMRLRETRRDFFLVLGIAAFILAINFLGLFFTIWRLWH